jgi:UDP-glucose 4-epimerase
MRTLVTGGAGFIGSNLVDALIARGDEVTVLDDLSSGRRENLIDALAAGAELVTGSVTDRELVADVVAAQRPEAIFHLAAQIDVRDSVADPLHDLQVNAGGTINLLDAARDNATRRFVLASTGGAIYGEGTGLDLPLDESAACRPLAPYGQSKFSAEGYVSLYGRLHGVSGIALRLGNVYGPRQDPHGEAGVVAILCGAMLGGRPPRIFGDGLQTRDYVYVADVVAAMIAGAESDTDGYVNIGTGREANVLELGRVIAGALGVPFDPIHEPERPGEVRRIAISPAAAEAAIGWRAEVPLEVGLRLTAESIRAQRPAGASAS